jgi:hypothetical protein
VELEPMIVIRTITTKNKEGVLIFEEFDAEVNPIKVLDQVWLSVTNVPTPLHAFLPLLAIGFVVGATQKLDMAHLRQTREVRILVAVLDTRTFQKRLIFVSIGVSTGCILKLRKWYRMTPLIQRGMICWVTMQTMDTLMIPIMMILTMVWMALGIMLCRMLLRILLNNLILQMSIFLAKQFQMLNNKGPLLVR